MKKTMSKLLIIGLLTTNIFAIGGLDSIPKDERDVMTDIQSSLLLSNKDTYKVYQDYLQAYFNSNDWSVSKLNGESPSSSRVKDNKTKILFLELMNDTRTVSLSFVKFQEQKQLFIHSIESLPRNSTAIEEKYEKLKNDSKFNKNTDNSKYSSFTEKGYMSRVNLHLVGNSGEIKYIDLRVMDLE